MIENKIDISPDKNYDIDTDVSNKLGYLLLKKGIIESNTLVQAVLTKKNEVATSNGNGKPRRNLAQILVQDFNFNHDLIFKEVANLYAFQTLEFDFEEDDLPKIDKIKKFVDSFDEDLKKQMLSHRVIPIKYDDNIKDKIILRFS